MLVLQLVEAEAPCKRSTRLNLFWAINVFRGGRDRSKRWGEDICGKKGTDRIKIYSLTIVAAWPLQRELDTFERRKKKKNEKETNQHSIHQRDRTTVFRCRACGFLKQACSSVSVHACECVCVCVCVCVCWRKEGQWGETSTYSEGGGRADDPLFCVYHGEHTHLLHKIYAFQKKEKRKKRTRIVGGGSSGGTGGGRWGGGNSRKSGWSRRGSTLDIDKCCPWWWKESRPFGVWG